MGDALSAQLKKAKTSSPKINIVIPNPLIDGLSLNNSDQPIVLRLSAPVPLKRKREPNVPI